MSDLFTKKPKAPWAELLRPNSIAEIVGQKHLLAAGMPLKVAFDSAQLHSMIFWGPPGVGKTTLARLCAQAFAGEFIALSAVLSGVKELRSAMQQAEHNLLLDKKTILFIDEIHRFNKAQQDALLPHIESGLITFIGATTENPSFEVNSALLSRVQVYVLQPLTDSELLEVIERAQAKGLLTVEFDTAAKELLVNYADGDARRILNLLEQVSGVVKDLKIERVTAAVLKTSIRQNTKGFDKKGDQFYDLISALHKSVRGSNPDAALYWFCRMLDAGVDVKYLSRRIVRMAWEDIGLADPRALQLANDAATTYERLGSPEGDLALAQAVIYLAVAAKSNAGYVAFNQARAFIKRDKTRAVPLHLRNAPSALMQDLGYGSSYRYAHDEPHGYAAGENYFPEDMAAPNWYQPVNRGLEEKIRQKISFLQQLDAAEKTGSKNKIIKNK